MKKMFNKVVAGLLAVCMILCYMPIAYAVVTEEMTEEDAGTVNVFASSVTVQQSADEQTVDIVLLSDKNIQVGGLDVGYTCSSGATLGVGVPGNDLSGSPTNQSLVVTNGNGAYMTYSSENSGYVLCTVPVTIAANATGSCTVSFNDIEIYDADNGEGYSLNSNTVTSTITIESTTPEGGEGGNDDNEGSGESGTPAIPENPTFTPENVTYSVGLGVDKSAAKVGETVLVSVLVGGQTGKFASAEMQLTVNGLTYNEAGSTLNGASVQVTGNAIKIVDHGDTTDWTEGNSVTAYTLAFTVNEISGATATATATLDSAKLSTAENAIGADLTVADINSETKVMEIVVTPADLTVELPSEFDGDESVVYGGTYTFEATGTNVYYDYTFTVNGTETNVDYDASTGKWTIENVTEDLKIEIVNKVAKKFSVTIDTMDHLDTTTSTPATGANAATYNTDYTFTLKADEDPQAGQVGYTYTVSSITIGGTAYSANTNGKTVTISGNQITGDIVITTEKNEVQPNQYTITLNADGFDNGELTVNPTSVVDKNGSITLTLTPVDNFDYTVTYTMGGGESTEITTWTDGGNGTQTATITNVTGNVVITASKEGNSSNLDVDVTDYIALSGLNMKLIKINTVPANGYTYTYDGKAMYTKNGSYVYLVIVDANADFDEDAAKAQIKIVKSDITAGNIEGGYDVNMSGYVDANDAQLVWNMYSAKTYTDFTEVSMKKFLLADVNNSDAVDTDDAAAIITAILNGTANN